MSFAGVVFLQYRDEVKRTNLPSNVNSLEALKALFVNAFPGKVAMPHFEEGHKSLYIKDLETGVYYQLEDISEVVNRSFLKIQELDVLSDSQSEASAYIYRTQTLPNKGQHYAESLQDYHLTSPGMRRGNSYSSLRSENISSRPTYLSNEMSDPYSYIEDNHVQINDPVKKQQAEKVPEMKNSQVPLPQASVQDQLEDLSELLRTALHDEDKYHANVMHEVDVKNPGKLDQHLIEDVQYKTETLARKKKSLPAHFQPTAFILAQQETDRVTPPGQELPNSPTRVKSSTVITINSRAKNNAPNEPPAKPEREVKQINESYITAAKKQQYENKPAPVASAKNINKDIIRHNSYNAKLSTPSPTPAAVKTKDEPEELSYSADIANSLLSQLEDLEEEVKAQSSSLESSRSSSFRNSRTSSTSSSQRPNAVKSSNPTTVEDVRTRGLSIPAAYEPYSSHSQAKTRSMTVPDDFVAQQDNHTMTVSEAAPVYAQVNKNKNEVPTQSHTVTTFDAPYETVDGDVFVHSSPKKSSHTNRAGEECRKASVTTPDFTELESSAVNVRSAIRGLKKDLEEMRKNHMDTRRNFKADIQKKLLEFRKKATRVEEGLQHKLDLNNNFIFANEHPVRERRHRVTADQIEYNQKMESTQEKLESLEGEMELLRADVVTKKKVENPQDLDNVHNELTSATKGLAELKNRYHGLHDMLKNVMASEMEIIRKEEIFLKEEPAKLEELINRCKNLSGTLFTLQKLASVQTVSPVNAGNKSQQQFLYQDQSPARSLRYNQR